MVRFMSLLFAALVLGACAQNLESMQPASASAAERCSKLTQLQRSPSANRYQRVWAEEQMRAQQCGDAVPLPAGQ